MLKCLYLLGIIFMITSCSQNHTQIKQAHHLHLNFLDGDIPALHPHLLASHVRGITLGSLLFEGLTRIKNDGNASLAGAEKVEISQDQKRYVFTLRSQKWSDGSTVTADHYVFAWKSALTPQADCPRADLFYIIKNAKKAKKGEVALEEMGVRALDAKTLVIDLEYPSSHFLKLLAQPLFFPLKTQQGEPLCFNGPFVLNSWQKGMKMYLTSNPHFWNRKAIDLQDIEINFVTDAQTAFHLFEKGEIDWIGAPLCRLAIEDGIKLKESKKTLQKPLNRYFWTYLNTQHPVLKSLKIRQALASAIDRHQITDHIFISDEPLYTPIQDSMIPSPQFQTHNSTIQTLIQDGLEELGLTLESTPPIILSYFHGPGFKSLAEYLKTCWEDLCGLPIQLQGVEWNVLRHNLDRGEFAIASCYQGIVCDDPIELFERFEELGAGNWPQWENQPFKEKLAVVRQEVDEERRKMRLQEAEQILVEQMPFIPICRAVSIYAHNPKLKNYVFDSTGCVDFAYATFTK